MRPLFIIRLTDTVSLHRESLLYYLDDKVKEALGILGFSEEGKIPRLKDIRKMYIKLSITHHPDKNGGTVESKEKFQRILEAYNIAGKACEDTIYDDDNDEDKMARRMFKQFCFSSVKENLNSFTWRQMRIIPPYCG